MSNGDDINNGDIIRYIGGNKADIRFHDGALRHAVGVKHYQVVRANRNKKYAMDGEGWTYNHAPMLAYWNDTFFLEYLSCPVSEHIPPSKALLCHSVDGINWSLPEVVFPSYSVPSKYYNGPKKELLGETVQTIIHHRMGFYVTSDNRLLVSTFYGISPTHSVAPNNGWGVGRVVREVYNDFSFSEIYFIRYNEKAGFNKDNTPTYKSYKTSSDTGFVAACDELLGNRLVTQQWWEEERLDTEFFTQPGAQAISYYTLSNDNIVGVFKNAKVSVSNDKGEHWSELQTAYSIETSTGKVWGQKMPDGKYALVYNPTTDGAHRWPLAIVTGDNGTDFDNMLAVTAEVTPCRYAGLLKNLGPQYVRGICEANPRPKTNEIWLTYSVNKEDIWISKIPVPVIGSVDNNTDESFNMQATDENINRWNIYSPVWAKAAICSIPSADNKSIKLDDRDPYDHARAEKVIKAADKLSISAGVMAEQINTGSGFVIELCDDKGAIPIKLAFKPDGRIYAKSAGRYELCCDYTKNEWYDVAINADCYKNEYTLIIKHLQSIVFENKFKFSQSVFKIERVVFASKDMPYMQGLECVGKNGDIGDLPDSEIPVQANIIYINYLNNN